MSLFTSEQMQNMVDLMLSAPTRSLISAYDFRPTLDLFVTTGKAVQAGGVLQVLDPNEWADIQAARAAAKKAKEIAALPPQQAVERIAVDTGDRPA